jgi:DNA-3-methyladenine glycosylase II
MTSAGTSARNRSATATPAGRAARARRATPAAQTARAMTAADYVRARRVLSRRDPVLRGIIAACGPCRLADGQRDHGLQAMLESIVWQQLSGKAAATIFARFLALFPAGRFPSAGEILAAPPLALRQAGLSAQKASYIRDVCARVTAGTLDFDRLQGMTDEEVVATLTEVRGIGRWSAEMFLMFRLHRPDVLPVGDLGIVKAIQRAYGLRKPPTAPRMYALGRRWQPYRSVASWYLWASLK